MKRMLGILMLALLTMATACGKPTAEQQLAKLKARATAGNAAAQDSLGDMYRLGEGVPQDNSEAVKWYRLAAVQGLAIAQYNLARMYGTGKGVPQDDAETVKWLRLAADQGLAIAQGALGDVYSNGTGVPEDFLQAYKWLNLAAAALEDTTFVRYAVEGKNRVARNMTKEQIAEAQRLSTAFTPTKKP